jgi:arylsulfatase A-like enzyme
VPPAIRHPRERQNPHPVYGAFMGNAIGQAFSRDEVREKAIPAYMGLIKQVDDQMGRLFGWLEATGRMQDTMIVLTSDHGDYLGDHWLGEKDLFHEPSVKVPLIVYDPRADKTRGTTCDALVEQIDLLPTFLAAAGGKPAPHILEGRSLMPWLRGETPEWRDHAISEYDYSATPMAVKLGVAPRDARLFMVTDGRWKFMHAEGCFRPMLFDLQNDPDEFIDLGDSPDHAEVIALMYDRLGRWGRRMSQRVTRSDEDIAAMRGKSRRKGVLLGVFEAGDVDAELTAKYRGKVPDRS